MPKKRFTPEQIVKYLRTAEIEIAKGRTVPDVDPLPFLDPRTV